MDHGPIPGSAASRARCSFQSAPAPRSMSLLRERAGQSHQRSPRRCGIARLAGAAWTSAAGVGNSDVRPPAGSGTGSPYAATNRAAWVRAAAVETCCPSTVGSRIRFRPRSAAPDGPGLSPPAARETGSVLSWSSTAIGSASRSRSRRQRLIATGRSRRSVSDSWHPTWSGEGRSATMPWPCGSRSVRR